MLDTLIVLAILNKSKNVDDEDEEQKEEIEETSQYDWLQDRFNGTN